MKKLWYLLLAGFVVVTCAERKVECGSADAQIGRSEYKIYYQGEERKYVVYLPSSYDYKTTLPVLFALHGEMSDSEGMEEITHLSEYADEKGVIVVYPEGTGFFRTWNAGKCCGYALTHDVDDVGFMREVLSQIKSEYCVDEDKIFATGFSNGGMMAYRLACETSDTFSGIASVAGSMAVSECNPIQPVSVVHFHGTEDLYVRYEGGESEYFPLSFTAVSYTIEFWRNHNGCNENPTIMYENGDVRCEGHNNCAESSVVILCTVFGGGHTWPGGEEMEIFGYTTPYISASEFIIDTFLQLP